MEHRCLVWRPNIEPQFPILLGQKSETPDWLLFPRHLLCGHQFAEFATFISNAKPIHRWMGTDALRLERNAKRNAQVPIHPWINFGFELKIHEQRQINAHVIMSRKLKPMRYKAHGSAFGIYLFLLQRAHSLEFLPLWLSRMTCQQAFFCFVFLPLASRFS